MRFLLDRILPVSLTRRLIDNTFLNFVTNYPYFYNKVGNKPYAPNPLAGRILTGACLTQGMPPIDFRFARMATSQDDMTYPQDLAAFKTFEDYVGFSFNVSQESPTLPTHHHRNHHNMQNTMFAFRSWIPFAYAFYGELFTKLQPCYVITPTRENRDEMCSILLCRTSANLLTN